MAAAFVTHSDCLKHDMGAHHPEQPARLSAIEDQLIASGVAPYLSRFEAPFATDEQLARVHPLEYVRAIREVAPSEDVVERKEQLDEDIDAILDEIDDVLESNAEDFVKSFIQKGGQ